MEILGIRNILKLELPFSNDVEIVEGIFGGIVVGYKKAEGMRDEH